MQCRHGEALGSPGADGARYTIMWLPSTKADPLGRSLADRHYSRQTPGASMWTRPGYNYVLRHESPTGRAVFVWWRPKWEDSRPGTSRKDGLRCLECTIFRREGKTPLASQMIRAAVFALWLESADSALHLGNSGEIPLLLTGVSSEKTKRGRGSSRLPGACFRYAGWKNFQKSTRNADIWLQHPWKNLFGGHNDHGQ